MPTRKVEDLPPETVDRVVAGKQIRNDLKARFSGDLPTSVLTIREDKGLRRRIRFWQKERDATPTRVVRSSPDHLMHRATACGVGGSKGAYSICPPELVRLMLLFYQAKAGDLYVDPFAGQGVRLQTAALFGLDYHGQDLTPEFVTWIEKEILPKIDPEIRATVLLQDSREIALDDGVGDFCLTSPPYYDVEVYPSDEDGELSQAPTYTEFLAGMAGVGRDLLRVMKPGAYAVAQVGDFRRGGRFYAYHSDLTAAWRDVGWDLVDTWIIRMYRWTMSSIFAPKQILRRQAPKQHEYALVFRKPE